MLCYLELTSKINKTRKNKKMSAKSRILRAAVYMAPPLKECDILGTKKNKKNKAMLDKNPFAYYLSSA